jgi:hypothetical protein
MCKFVSVCKYNILNISTRREPFASRSACFIPGEASSATHWLGSRPGPVFLDETRCVQAARYQRFGGTCCFNLQYFSVPAPSVPIFVPFSMPSLFLCAEAGDSRFLRNVGNDLSDYLLSHPTNSNLRSHLLVTPLNLCPCEELNSGRRSRSQSACEACEVAPSSDSDVDYYIITRNLLDFIFYILWHICSKKELWNQRNSRY